jgi:hypothetical protein
MPQANTIHRTALALGLLAAGAPALAAAKKSKSARRDSDSIGWSRAVVLEPGAITGTPDSAPLIQFQQALSRDYDHPHSLAVSYWGRTFDSNEDPGYATADADSVTGRRDRRSIFGVTARYMLYLTRSFHFNFGGGFRTTRTEERAFLANGETFDAKKSATSLGIDIGLGNRWVLSNGLVLGGTWFQHFIPVAVVQSKDARLPDGYEAGDDILDGSGARHDGMTMSYRIAADIGYAW